MMEKVLVKRAARSAFFAKKTQKKCTIEGTESSRDLSLRLSRFFEAFRDAPRSTDPLRQKTSVSDKARKKSAFPRLMFSRFFFFKERPDQTVVIFRLCRSNVGGQEQTVGCFGAARTRFIAVNKTSARSPLCVCCFQLNAYPPAETCRERLSIVLTTPPTCVSAWGRFL